MAVTGGDDRRGRTSSWAAVAKVGWLLLLSVACGGRTAVAGDVYDTDAPGSSHSSGGSSRGGASAQGGGAPVTAGSSGGPANAVTEACKHYCGAFPVLCPERLSVSECQSNCPQELTNFGDRCRELGVAAINCLTPYFTKPGGGTSSTCSQAVDVALKACAMQTQAFEACKNAGAPVLEPDPTKAPWACETVVGVGESSCGLNYYCADGLWTVSCAATGGAAICDCIWPQGSYTQFDAGKFTVGASCHQATLQCFGASK